MQPNFRLESLQYTYVLALPVIRPLFAIILLNLIHISLHICVLKLLLDLSPEFFSFILLKRSTGYHGSTKRTAILSAPRSHADRCPMAGTDILCSGEILKVDKASHRSCALPWSLTIVCSIFRVCAIRAESYLNFKWEHKIPLLQPKFPL